MHTLTDSEGEKEREEEALTKNKIVEEEKKSRYNNMNQTGRAFNCEPQTAMNRSNKDHATLSWCV